MIKRVKSSLFAKVFLSTAWLLLCGCLLVFFLLAWLMPQTYSSGLNAILDERSRNLVSELERVSFAGSGGLFDQFLADTQIHSAELYSSSGDLIPLPTKTEESGQGFSIAQSAETGLGEASPVLSNQYYFSFAGCTDRYILIVYGQAQPVLELQRCFLRVFPLILLMVLAAALALSWLYSRMITRPVLKLSRISQKMSALQLDWQIEEERTDELGTLGKSLNRLARSLSAALTDLQCANRGLETDLARKKELERARIDFFSAVSHELKTPVTILKGQLEGMLLGIGAYKDHEKYLARSLKTTNTLEGMVQELLTISRLETMEADLKRERLDCGRMVRAYLNETEDQITGRDLRIHLALSPHAFIMGNKLLMEKVFSNLIGNALKYSPHGADIWISAQMEQGRMEFSVENAGRQIAEEHLPRLFDAFYRVEQSRNRKTGGSGLGLYLVQKILHRHKSECTVSNTQAGVKFSFVM